MVFFLNRSKPSTLSASIDTVLPENQDNVVLKSNTRAKRLTLRFDVHKNLFTLTTPPRTSSQKIHDFLTKSSTWMEKQSLKKLSPIAFEPGLILSILGTEKTLIHDPHFIARSVVETESEIIVQAPLNRFSYHVKMHLKKRAKDLFTTWCDEYCANLPRSIFKKPKITSITIKDTKSRWGSCSSMGTISLSWRLILAPEAVAKYVCLHECCHLVEMNHSNAFWHLVHDQDPEFNAHKKWLKDHGNKLFCYG